MPDEDRFGRNIARYGKKSATFCYEYADTSTNNLIAEDASFTALVILT